MMEGRPQHGAPSGLGVELPLAENGLEWLKRRPTSTPLEKQSSVKLTVLTNKREAEKSPANSENNSSPRPTLREEGIEKNQNQDAEISKDEGRVKTIDNGPREAQFNDRTSDGDASKDPEQQVAAAIEVLSPKSMSQSINSRKDQLLSSSSSRPVSMPVVVVDLERLVGYPPSTPEEKASLANEIRGALFASDDEDGEEEEGVSRCFNERVQELFQTGIAQHAEDTTCAWATTTLRYTVVEYPEYYWYINIANDTVLWVTAKEWKGLYERHDVAVVSRLCDHLRNCSRTLGWKREMQQQVWNMAEHEQDRLQESLLHEWRVKGRSKRLDKLYLVRETFQHRLERTEQQLEEQLQDYDNEQARYDPGIKASDLSLYSVFHHMEDPVGPMEKNSILRIQGGDNEAEVIEERTREEQEAEEDTVDDDSDLEHVGTMEPEQSGETTRASQPKSEGDKAGSQTHQELEHQGRAFRESETERQKPPEIRRTQALVQSLEKRLKQIDDLLESLQEEEWADEEEGYTARKDASQDGKDDEGASVLHSILAMVLGSLPRGLESDEAAHLKYIFKEHEEIARGWKEYFGRLPQSLPLRSDNSGATLASNSLPAGEQTKLTMDSESGITSPADLRMSLGFVDNENDNWDAVDDWDALLPNVNVGKSNPEPSKQVVQSQGTPKKGLRPGGRLS